jgi:hypothetical protein
MIQPLENGRLDKPLGEDDFTLSDIINIAHPRGGRPGSGYGQSEEGGT